MAPLAVTAEQVRQIVDYFKKRYSYVDICCLMYKNHNFSISLRSLKRLLKTLHLRRKNFTESLPEEILVAVQLELLDAGSDLGHKAMWQRINKIYDVQSKQKTVLLAMQVLDPEGVAERLRRRLKRRKYTVPGPNFLWHIDGYDKIKRFGFPIHGCIDGYSKKVLWLEMSKTNNDPNVIAYYYLNTVKTLGYLPTLVRSDCGTETILVEDFQKLLRMDHDDEHAGEKSYITGKSTSNQRIECYWRQLRRLAINFFINLFKAMEAERYVNVKNPFHIEALRLCFGPLIYFYLKTAKEEWNEHRIRKQEFRQIAGGKPDILYQLPEGLEMLNTRKMSISNLSTYS